MNAVYKATQVAKLEAEIARHDALESADKADGNDPLPANVKFRSALVDALDALNALPAESNTPVGADGEGDEFAGLLDKVELRNWFGAYATGNRVVGGELELNQHFGLDDNSEFPLMAILKHRAATVLTDGDYDRTVQAPLTRVLKGGAAAFLGITPTIVPAGQVVFPKVTVATDAVQKAKSASTTPTAATLATEKLTALRSTVAYEFAYQEAKNWGNDGLEQTLLADMRGALIDQLDNMILNGTGLTDQPTGILTAVTATPATEPTDMVDFAGLVAEAVDGIDGQYARSEADIRWLVHPDAWRLARKTYLTNTAISALADIRASGVAVQASALMPATTNGGISKAIRFADALAARLIVWEAARVVRSEVQATDEIRLDIHNYANFVLLRTDGIAHRQFKVTA